MTSEHTIQNWILATLGIETITGGWRSRDGRAVWWRNNTGATKTASGGFLRYGLGVGGADVIGVVDGRMVALEVKRPGQRLRRLQAEWRQFFENAGGLYRVVTNPSEAIAAVREICPDAQFNTEV